VVRSKTETSGKVNGENTERVSMLERRFPLVLIAIIVVAVAIRIYLTTGSTSWAPHTIDEDRGSYIVRGMRLSGDPGPIYHRVARNFLAGRGLVNEPEKGQPTRAPLYPLLLAGMYALFDEPLLPIGIVHALLGGLTCLFVGLATRIVSNDATALLAAAVTAVMPEFLKYTPVLYASSLLVFLVAAFLLLMFVARRRGVIGWYAAGGIVLGLVALTRLELLVLWPAVALWCLIDSTVNWRARLARAAMVTMGVVLVTMPWLLYNRTSSVNDLAKAGGGDLGHWFWWQLGPYAQTCWEDPPTGSRGIARGLGAAAKRRAFARIKTELGTDDPHVLNAYLKREAVSFMMSHPLRVAELMLSRLMMLWNIWPTPPPPLSMYVAYWLFLGVALWAVIAGWRVPEVKLLAFTIIAVTLFYSFIHGHPRYRLPATVALIMLFSIGTTRLWALLIKRSQPDETTVLEGGRTS